MVQSRDLDPEIGYQLYGGGEESYGDSGYAFGLLSHLRAAGLPIGPREHLAAGVLLAELLADLPPTEPRNTLADFRAQLAPLLARTPEETETFGRVFDALAPRWRASVAGGASAQEVSVGVAPGAAERVRTKINWRRWGVTAGIGALAVALLVWLWLSLFPPSVTPVEPAPPSGPSDISNPAPSTVPVSVAPEDAEALRSLTRVRDAIAAKTLYIFAPTLSELSASLAQKSAIGWNAAGYEQRLHELTGLERSRPLDLSGVGESARTLATLATALDLIERPGQGGAFARYQLAAATAAPPENSARALRAVIDAGVEGPLPEERAEALAAIKQAITGRHPLAAFDDAIERALAIEPDPRLSWLTPAPPGWHEPKVKAPPWWALILAALTPLALCAAWLANALVFKRAFLRRRKPEFPPLLLDLRSKAHSTIGFAADAFREAARKLARRTPKQTDRLDLEKTVQASLRGGGLIVEPVFATTRNTPEYLVLIERRAPGDHDYERMRQMAGRLKEVLPVSIFAYQTEPAFLDPEDDGRAESIDRLSAKYPDHRLIVLGTGEGFLSVRTLEPTPAAEKLMRWDRRALLTPLPVAEWAQDEFQLARALQMPIGRATPEGFAALADLLGLEGEIEAELVRPTGDNLAQPLPAILRLDPEDLLYPNPPDDRPISTIIAQLRTYLDAPGFDWLCALAVYPAIQWDLTLYLGAQLPRLDGGDPKDDPLYSEERIAAIALLPWFREGQMPNWLRRALIGAMTPTRERQVRVLVQDLLRQATLPEPKTDEDKIRFKLIREQMAERQRNEPVVGPPPELLMEDQVLVDFLAKGDVTDLEYTGPDARPEQERRFRLGWIEILGAGVATAYSAAALFAVPKPWEGPAPTGAWLGLVLLVFGSVLGTAIVAWRRSYEGVRVALERLVSPAITVALLLLAFAGLIGPDGQSRLLQLFAAGVLLTPVSRWIANRLGVFFPSIRGGFGSRVGSTVVEGACAGLVASILFALTTERVGSTWDGVVQGIAGGTPFIPSANVNLEGVVSSIGLVCLVLALGLVAARFAPEKLPPPREKSMFGSPGAWRPAALAAGVLLAAALPAVIFAGWFQSTHFRLETAEAPGEGVIATSPDGRLIAVASADGALRTFDAAAPREPLAIIAMPSRSPVVSLAIRQVANGPALVAAAQANGGFAVFDARGGASVFTMPAAPRRPIVSMDQSEPGVWIDFWDGLRTLVAIGPDGQWAYAHQVNGAAQIVSGPAGLTPITVSSNAPVLAFAAADDAPGRWIAALGDGSIVLASAGGVQPATPDVRLPGRARMIAVSGQTIRAIGDDGSILEADVTPAGLANARLLPADARLALGPAVGWQVGQLKAPTPECMSLAQQVQQERSDPAAPNSRAGEGPKVRALRAAFAERCPGLNVNDLAKPPQTVANSDPPQCAPFANEWASQATAARSEQATRLLARVPAICAQLRAEISRTAGPRLPDVRGATDQVIVFFDWDSSTLTPEAMAVIDDALKRTPPEKLTRVVVIGHTDTVNSAAYAQQFSARMAASVSQALVGRGVRPELIEQVGRGQSDLMVQTGNGVREPQNRRVVVSLFAGRQQAQISPSTPAGTIFRDRAEGLPESAIPEMVVIQAGSFLMGSPDSELDRDTDEGPQRRVTIGQPFAAGRFEVTFDEWAACVAGGGCSSNPSPADQGWGRGRRPVINVSWSNAQEYVRWLSQTTGQRYRLLSEAEWEYAARAGTPTRWSFGDDESQLGTYAWFSRISNSRTQPVGGKIPNRFGLHDVHGNVWEWVEDCYAENYSGLATNGSANTTQGCSFRVNRGGGWGNYAQYLRSAYRNWDSPANRGSFLGFRVARTL